MCSRTLNYEVGRSAVSASMSALSVRCRQLGSAGGAGEPQNRAECQPGSAPISSRPVLAMQKVEGSSPFIRFQNPVVTAGFRAWAAREV